MVIIWIFTTGEFLSAVAHRDYPGMLMVRARDRRSLEPLRDMFEVDIIKTDAADYPFRVVVAKEDLIQFLTLEVEAIDYDNFKSAHRRGTVWHDALMDVWTAMHKVSPGRAGTGRRGGRRGVTRHAATRSFAFDDDLELTRELRDAGFDF